MMANTISANTEAANAILLELRIIHMRHLFASQATAKPHQSVGD
jgi:hypothetical protein